MPKKIDFYENIDRLNPDVQTTFCFVQGVGVEIQRGKSEQVRPVFAEVIRESDQKYANFATSNLNVDGRLDVIESL